VPSEYPPKHHLTRDLRLCIERGDAGSRARMPIVREIQDERGAAGVGALATLIDMHAGALAIDAAHPNWLATLDLAIHLARPLVGKQVETRGAILRSGRQTIATELALATDAEPDAGVATMTYAVLPRRADTPVYDRDFAATSSELALPDSGLSEPFERALGIRVTDATRGEAEVDLAPYVTNSLAALQGGAAATLAEVAGRAFASALLGRAAFTTDFEMRYLALGKRAPIRASSRLVRRDANGCLVRVEVRESGDDARICYVAFVACA
jgi:acyl-coenzyme A thioesterase PaaI-like protein